MNDPIHERIRQFRKNSGLTQQGLADALGVHRNTVQGWERGLSVPTRANVMALAPILGVDASEIASFHEPGMTRLSDPRALDESSRDCLYAVAAARSHREVLSAVIVGVNSVAETLPVDEARGADEAIGKVKRMLFAVRDGLDDKLDPIASLTPRQSHERNIALRGLSKILSARRVDVAAAREVHKLREGGGLARGDEEGREPA